MQPVVIRGKARQIIHVQQIRPNLSRGQNGVLQRQPHRPHPLHSHTAVFPKHAVANDHIGNPIAFQIDSTRTPMRHRMHNLHVFSIVAHFKRPAACSPNLDPIQTDVRRIRNHHPHRRIGQDHVPQHDIRCPRPKLKTRIQTLLRSRTRAANHRPPNQPVRAANNLNPVGLAPGVVRSKPNRICPCVHARIHIHPIARHQSVTIHQGRQRGHRRAGTHPQITVVANR